MYEPNTLCVCLNFFMCGSCISYPLSHPILLSLSSTSLPYLYVIIHTILSVYALVCASILDNGPIAHASMQTIHAIYFRREQQMYSEAVVHRVRLCAVAKCMTYLFIIIYVDMFCVVRQHQLAQAKYLFIFIIIYAADGTRENESIWIDDSPSHQRHCRSKHTNFAIVESGGTMGDSCTVETLQRNWHGILICRYISLINAPDIPIGFYYYACIYHGGA